MTIKNEWNNCIVQISWYDYEYDFNFTSTSFEGAEVFFPNIFSGAPDLKNLLTMLK